MATAHHQSRDHEFKGTWRWPDSFESWVRDFIADTDGPVANICAGLSPLGDVRVDLETPTELIESLQADSGTNLERARTYLQDHVAGTPQVDVISSLFTADNPTAHPAAEYIQTDASTVRVDIFSENLPFNDNTFSWTIADPPWIDVSNSDRDHLMEELVRVTKPGGHILHNAFWIPTGDYAATLDKLVPRQDTERWSVGTPKVSWVGIYTVHDSIHTARHLSRTLPHREYEPEPPTIEDAVRAQADFKLRHRSPLSTDDYDLDAVDPATDSLQCPKCGCQKLNPVAESVGPTTNSQTLYECASCQFRPYHHELTESKQGTDATAHQTLCT
jgi:SAM-dependent methyltransferase